MNRCALCIRMLQLLRARGRMQINEIARELETNPRNIREFKKELETAGYVIRQFTENMAGISWMKKFFFLPWHYSQRKYRQYRKQAVI